MLGSIEQEICRISYMNPNRKLKLNDLYMEKDPPIWIDDDFECMNISVHDRQRRTLLKNKPMLIVYEIVEKSINWNHKIEGHGYSESFGEECVERFVKETLKRNL